MSMTVQFAAVQTGVTDINTVGSRIDGQLGDLASYLAPLAASWEGQAQTDWQALQARWDADAANMRQILADIGGALQTAHDNYVRAENANSTMWAV